MYFRSIGCKYVHTYVCALHRVISNIFTYICTYVYYTVICCVHSVEMKMKVDELKKSIHLKEMMHKSILDQKVYILCSLAIFYCCTSCSCLIDITNTHHSLASTSPRYNRDTCNVQCHIRMYVRMSVAVCCACFSYFSIGSR